MGSEGAIHGRSSRNVLRHGSILDVPRVYPGAVWGAAHTTGIRVPGSERSPAVQTLRYVRAAPTVKVKHRHLPGPCRLSHLPTVPSSLSLCTHLGASCLRPCWDRSLHRVMEVFFASSLSDDMEGGGEGCIPSIRQQVSLCPSPMLWEIGCSNCLLLSPLAP